MIQLYSILSLTLLSYLSAVHARAISATQSSTATAKYADFRHLPTAYGQAFLDGKHHEEQYFFVYPYGQVPDTWYAAPGWTSFCDIRKTQTIPMNTTQEVLKNVPYERFGFDAEGWIMVNYTLPVKSQHVCRAGTPYQFKGYTSRQVFDFAIPLLPQKHAANSPMIVKLTPERESLDFPNAPAQTNKIVYHDRQHTHGGKGISISTTKLPVLNGRENPTDEDMLAFIKEQQEINVRNRSGMPPPSASPIVVANVAAAPFLSTPAVEMTANGNVDLSSAQKDGAVDLALKKPASVVVDAPHASATIHIETPTKTKEVVEESKEEEDSSPSKTTEVGGEPSPSKSVRIHEEPSLTTLAQPAQKTGENISAQKQVDEQAASTTTRDENPAFSGLPQIGGDNLQSILDMLNERNKEGHA